jgi:hypothetical protein
LMASAIAACASAAVAQTAAPAADPSMAPDAAMPAPPPAAAPAASMPAPTPAPATNMVPIPGTDQSMMNRFDDPLVKARVARSGGK